MEENKQSTEAQGAEKPKVERMRKMSIGVDQLEEMRDTKGLLEEVLKAYHVEPEQKISILIATAKGALRQQSLKLK